jgi:hypothetical protein
MARFTPSSGGYTPPARLDTSVQYEVRIDEAEFTKSARKGTEGFQVTLSIVDGPDAPDGESPIGRTVRDTLWLPNPSMKDGGDYAQRLIDRFFAAFGLPSDGVEEPADAVGAEGKVTFRYEEDAAGDPILRVNKYVVPKGEAL